MGQIVVNVGSFDLTSHNGNTAYSSVRYFDIPANAGITGCTATFAQHVNTGSFQGKSFSLNGAQAHPNTPWPTSGIALNTALLSTGQNTFRAAVKSQAGLSARWAIGDIYMTITYNDVGGGGGGGYDIGSLSVDKTSMTAGDSLTVSVGAASAGVYRDISIFLLPSSAGLTYVAQGHGSGAGSWTLTIPEAWCASYSPNDPSFEIRIYVDAYIAGGTPVGNTAKMVAVNVPASAVPTIGAFTATRDANGVDASITNYVQNYSKVNLAMGSVAGALGSSIQSYEITGAGFSAAAASAAFGPFTQTGNITFTAKVTDTRGRTATRTVTINVLPYTPVSGVNLTAYRSDALKAADDEGAYATLRGRRVFSSLDGQNAGTIKGRVYEKDTTPGGWTAMSDDTLLLLGGSMSIEKGYTAEIYINDKITAVVYVFQIPTAIVGIHITPGATGGGFGMYGQPNRWDFHKPVYANDIILTSSPNPNLLHNADFRNPINQRGVSSFAGTLVYGLDRWMSHNGTITVNNGYISFTDGGYLIQRVEGYHLMSKVVTGSVCLLDGTIVSGTVALPTAEGTTVAANLPSFGLFQMYFHNGCLNVEFIGGAVSIVAVKLEIGTVSTLHLDPPMDYGTELAKCQRYFQVIDTIPYGFCISGFGDNTETIRLLYNAPVPFRGPITVAHSGVLPIASASGALTGLDIVSISYALSAQNNSMVTLLCTASAAVSAGTIYVGHFTGGRIALSSDL